jgi:hypothetical protein
LTQKVHVGFVDRLSKVERSLLAKIEHIRTAKVWVARYSSGTMTRTVSQVVHSLHANS